MDATYQPNPTLDLGTKKKAYREIVMTVLSQFLYSSDSAIETVPVFDTVHDRYQLLDLGWHGEDERVFLPIVHLDLIEGKVWIQENRTDVDIARSLMQAGVERQDIVLGLHPASFRHMSD
jgi:XisI protein